TPSLHAKTFSRMRWSTPSTATRPAPSTCRLVLPAEKPRPSPPSHRAANIKAQDFPLSAPICSQLLQYHALSGYPIRSSFLYCPVAFSVCSLCLDLLIQLVHSSDPRIRFILLNPF